MTKKNFKNTLEPSTGLASTWSLAACNNLFPFATRSDEELLRILFGDRLKIPPTSDVCTISEKKIKASFGRDSMLFNILQNNKIGYNLYLNDGHVYAVITGARFGPQWGTFFHQLKPRLGSEDYVLNNKFNFLLKVSFPYFALMVFKQIIVYMQTGITQMQFTYIVHFSKIAISKLAASDPTLSWQERQAIKIENNAEARRYHRDICFRYEQLGVVDSTLLNIIRNTNSMSKLIDWIFDQYLHNFGYGLFHNYTPIQISEDLNLTEALYIKKLRAQINELLVNRI
jgi:hypothetical protein